MAIFCHISPSLLATDRAGAFWAVDSSRAASSWRLRLLVILRCGPGVRGGFRNDERVATPWCRVVAFLGELWLLSCMVDERKGQSKASMNDDNNNENDDNDDE
jgi:hypothetical protein